MASKSKHKKKKYVEPTIFGGQSMYCVGVITEDLKFGQNNYFMIKSINSAMKNNIGLDIQIFVIDQSQPCILPLAPLNNIEIISSWQWPIINTKSSLLPMCLGTCSRHIINYIFNLDLLSDMSISFCEMKEWLCDNRVINICRSEMYKDIIEKHFSCNVQDVIEDFNIETFVSKLISKEYANAKAK